LRMIAEFKLRLATDVAAVAGVFDNARHASSRRQTLVRVARQAVTARLPVLLPPILLLLPIMLVVVVGQHQTTQETGDDRQQCELFHCLTLTLTDNPVVFVDCSAVTVGQFTHAQVQESIQCAKFTKKHLEVLQCIQIKTETI